MVVDQGGSTLTTERQLLLRTVVLHLRYHGVNNNNKSKVTHARHAITNPVWPTHHATLRFMVACHVRVMLHVMVLLEVQTHKENTVHRIYQGVLD